MWLVFNNDTGIVISGNQIKPDNVPENYSVIDVDLTAEQFNESKEIIIRSIDPIVFSVTKLSELEIIKRTVQRQSEMIDLLIQMNLEREGII